MKPEWVRDCERFGISPAGFGPVTPPEPIPVWPDMREPFALLADAPWNWLSPPMAAPIRLNLMRGELEASARLLGITMTPAIFVDIRAMEAEAIKVWSKRRR